MGDLWVDTRCPRCHKANWVCQGDPADITGVDVEAVECWSCGGQYLLEGVEMDEIVMTHGEDGEPFLVRGRASPSDPIPGPTGPWRGGQSP